jgi:hypothetical protein
MARDEVGHEPTEAAERVANAALDAAKAHGQAEGDELLEAIVMVRLRSGHAASAGYREQGEVDGVWLASELAYRVKVVMEAMGKKVDFMFLDGPGGQG